MIKRWEQIHKSIFIIAISVYIECNFSFTDVTENMLEFFNIIEKSILLKYTYICL